MMSLLLVEKKQQQQNTLICLTLEIDLAVKFLMRLMEVYRLMRRKAVVDSCGTGWLDAAVVTVSFGMLLL